jgi:hypothetical protein
MDAPNPQRIPTRFTDSEIVEAWALETLLSIKDLHLSAPRGTTTELSIPLDAPAEDDEGAAASRAAYAPRRELGRRDSLKRREALLKGKAGTRRRQRWENGTAPVLAQRA